jgi:hypothetical protein
MTKWYLHILFIKLKPTVMKKLIPVLSLLLLFSIKGFSQIEKGTLLIGGSGGFDWEIKKSENPILILLNPNLGYFPANDFAVGASAGFTYFSNEDFSSVGLSFAPFVRYYSKITANNESVKFFIHGQSGMFWPDLKDSPEDNGYFVNIGPGLAVFLTKNAALEFGLNYYYSDYIDKDYEATKALLFNIGFQTYINRNKE